MEKRQTRGAGVDARTWLSMFYDTITIDIIVLIIAVCTVVVIVHGKEDNK